MIDVYFGDMGSSTLLVVNTEHIPHVYITVRIVPVITVQFVPFRLGMVS